MGGRKKLRVAAEDGGTAEARGDGSVLGRVTCARSPLCRKVIIFLLRSSSPPPRLPMFNVSHHTLYGTMPLEKAVFLTICIESCSRDKNKKEGSGYEGILWTKISIS